MCHSDNIAQIKLSAHIAAVQCSYVIHAGIQFEGFSATILELPVNALYWRIVITVLSPYV